MLTYLTGDATHPIDCGTQTRVITHVCNDIGAWGAGFTRALNRRWSMPEKDYRAWFASGNLFQLGAIKICGISTKICVCHMIAQSGVRRSASAPPPIQYDALAKCLQCLGEILNYAPVAGKLASSSVHMPRIGCGLAGGDWSAVEPLIEKNLVERNIPVYVYDLPEV
jgi:O-acetyl-ADP-ribose deacetylase (regulator of RNase III)